MRPKPLPKTLFGHRDARSGREAMIWLDHLVVAATDLATGVAWLEAKLGLPCTGGGQHIAMGTHNRLISLGDVYLEVIAIDGSLPAPQRARWFELDQPAMQQKLAAGPQLIHWVARCRQIEHLNKAPIIEMQRGNYHWRITVHEDGALPGGGVVPTLIEWGAGGHPLAVLPDSGARLRRLSLEHGNFTLFEKVMARLPFDDERIIIEKGDDVSIQAEIETVNGIVVL
jgi:Glyoxalase-like domain